MKIFVSSTYDDLREHRKAVDEIINRLCQQFRGMEYFGSRPFEPKHTCFSEIDQCHAFIGIYAHRYGWIPSGDSLSITEQEFDHARSNGIVCFCYVVDTEHPWAPIFIEHEAAEKLRLFKNKVELLVRSKFTTPDNLAKNVATDIARWINEQHLSLETAAFLPNNLPPRIDFFGRKKELIKLGEAIDSGLALTVVEGPPGSGKTSLVLEIAHISGDSFGKKVFDSFDLGTSVRTFEAIIWLSAKYRPVTMDNILDTIASVLDYPYITGLTTDKKEHDIRKHMRRIGCLIIIDNFETVGTEANEILAFLSNLPTHSKAIITTRYHTATEGRIMTLGNLTTSDGIAFIRHEAERLCLMSVSAAHTDSLYKLYDATGGSPLAIVWALGQMKKRGAALDRILADILQGRADIFQQLFGSAWELLTGDAKAMLMAMTVFRTSASRDSLHVASGIPLPTVDDALSQLIELSLIEVSNALEQTRIRYSVHPLTHAFAAVEASKDQQFITEAHARAVDYFIDFANLRRETEVSGEKAREVEPELDNILYLLTWCTHQQRWHYVADLVGAIEELLLILGLFEERIMYSRDAAFACEKLGDFGRKAHFLTLVGGTLPLQAKYGEAENALNNALQSARIAQDKAEISRALRTLALNAYRQGRYEQAENLLTGADDLALQSGDLHNYVDILCLRAPIELLQANLDKAESTLKLMLETAQQINWERAKAYCFASLAECMILKHDYKQAQELLESGLEVALNYGDRRQGARLKMSLANLNIYLGRLQYSEELALEAKDTFERLGMWNELSEVKAILERTKKRPKWMWSIVYRVSKPRVRYTTKPIGGD